MTKSIDVNPISEESNQFLHAENEVLRVQLNKINERLKSRNSNLRMKITKLEDGKYKIDGQKQQGSANTSVVDNSVPNRTNSASISSTQVRPNNNSFKRASPSQVRPDADGAMPSTSGWTPKPPVPAKMKSCDFNIGAARTANGGDYLDGVINTAVDSALGTGAL